MKEGSKITVAGVGYEFTTQGGGCEFCAFRNENKGCDSPEGLNCLGGHFVLWEDKTDWGQVRIQAAIVAMQGMMANPDPRIYFDDVPKLAVGYADALVEELKKEK